MFLSGANLSGAILSGANLSRAILSRAIGINPYLVNQLLMLKDQPGKIRAYKLVNEDSEGPFSRSLGYGAIQYEVGRSYEIADASTEATDGKFRVFRCSIVGEKDLVEIGLVPPGGRARAETGAIPPAML